MTRFLVCGVSRPSRRLSLSASVVRLRFSQRIYSTAISTPKTEIETGPEFLPLPRSLSSSKGLLLLSLPIAPVHWPSHLDLYSTLYRKATKELKSAGVAVNCIYDGVSTETSFKAELEGGEVYPARLYRGEMGAGMVRYSSFHLKSIDRVKSHLVSDTSADADGEGMLEILVCTHGSRDCRCSDHGGKLVDSLRSEIRHRGLEGRIKVGEIAHVGGHKYAANAITLPSLDMYSNLRHTDAVGLIDHLLTTSTTEKEPYTTPSPFWGFWRGRYGSSEKDQADIWSRIDPDSHFTGSAESRPVSSSVDDSIAVNGNLTFRTWDGDRRTTSVKVGETLLQVARRDDLPSMEGTCGGNLECSTCHLYVDGSAPIPEPSDEELDMLDYALGYRESESRLGCQIKVTERLLEWCEAGGELKLPKY